jgi:molybdopterin/thiamine biosynthesis adenylyltransferase
MNNVRYARNRFYVTDEEQERVKNCRILFGGVGIGSIVAECALRFGFENITVVDGDKVELTNLNRQNYTEEDVGKPKAETLAKRLRQINPDANIRFYNCFIDQMNAEEILDECDIAVNALDFTSRIPFVFDEICCKKNIPVIHPYNVGWAGLVTVTVPEGQSLSFLQNNCEGFELKMVEYVAQYSTFWHDPKKWLDAILERYKKEQGTLPLPQLAVASWIAAGFCTQIMYHLATGKAIKVFPKFYFASVLSDTN